MRNSSGMGYLQDRQTTKMPREHFKAIKHMNQYELEEFLNRIFKQGFETGVKATFDSMNKHAAVGVTEAGHSDAAP